MNLHSNRHSSGISINKFEKAVNNDRRNDDTRRSYDNGSRVWVNTTPGHTEPSEVVQDPPVNVEKDDAACIH